MVITVSENVGVRLAATQPRVLLFVCQVAVLSQLPLAAERKAPTASVTATVVEPVFPLLSVAVMVIVSATLSLVLMVKGLLARVLVLSPNTRLPSLSN